MITLTYPPKPRDDAVWHFRLGWMVPIAAVPKVSKGLVVDQKRIAELEAALRAIFDAADGARTELEWADLVSAAMTDDRRALVTSQEGGE